jgi:hypothetical protein
MVSAGFFSSGGVSAFTSSGGEVTAEFSCEKATRVVPTAKTVANNFRNIVIDFKC